jgi:chromosome partitioning protein
MLAAEQILKRNLEPVLDKYDFILFDCSPSLGMLTINALTAARELLIPMSIELLALRGLDMLARTFTKIHEMTNPELSYSSILAAKRDRRSSNSPRILWDNHFSSGSWSLKRSPAKKTE